MSNCEEENARLQKENQLLKQEIALQVAQLESLTRTLKHRWPEKPVESEQAE